MEKAKELRGRNYPYCPYVSHRNGKPFNQLRHGWDAACERVGVKGRTFHPTPFQADPPTKACSISTVLYALHCDPFTERARRFVSRVNSCHRSDG